MILQSCLYMCVLTDATANEHRGHVGPCSWAHQGPAERTAGNVLHSCACIQLYMLLYAFSRENTLIWKRMRFSFDWSHAGIILLTAHKLKAIQFDIFLDRPQGLLHTDLAPIRRRLWNTSRRSAPAAESDSDSQQGGHRTQKRVHL